MKRNIWLAVITCFLASITLVTILYFGSAKVNSGKNGFIRLLRTHVVDSQRILELSHPSYYIAGGTTSKIYLGNYNAPLEVLRTDFVLKDTHYVHTVLQDESAAISALHLQVDSPHIYLMEGITPSLFHGSLTDLHMSSFKQKMRHFSSSTGVAITPRSFIYRTYDRTLHRNLLEKTLFQPLETIRAPGLIVKQEDGIFCTDGMLHHSREQNMMIYVYFYRNQFVCFDTSMQLIYNGKTIDTNSRAKIKVASLRSENISTLASPPAFVNKISCVSGNRLYIHSALMANNENRKLFEEHPVIDVYQLNTGIYQFSFYLPGIKGNKLSFFRVFNRSLVTIQDKYLLTYHLNL